MVPVIGPVIEPDIKKPLFPSVAVIDAREPTFTVAVNWYNTSNASSATLWRAIGNSGYSEVATVSNGSVAGVADGTERCAADALSLRGDRRRRDGRCGQRAAWPGRKLSRHVEQSQYGHDVPEPPRL